MFRYTLCAEAVALALISVSTAALAAPASMSDSDYIAKVMTAAPAAVVKGATIVNMQSGTMRVVQTGTNGFTCMLAPPVGEPMCADKNAMAWIQAFATHKAPPDGVGFVYMLAGDQGASNTDPYASAATSDNHWIKTGSHVMIIGASVKTMGYPMTSDPDVTRPYVMWPDTPYAHLMIPVSVQP
jgi:hypothetical protein